MKLGEVIRKERERKDLGVEETAGRVGLPEDEYRRLEAGETAAEEWGPRLAAIAIELETPTSRLLAESGRYRDTREGQAGPLIAGHRQRRGKTRAELAAAVGISEDAYGEIEAGVSPLERWGPVFLAFAEAIEQPVFNLFYPCGLPFQELDDY